MRDSEIIVGAGGTIYSGPDAVNLFRANCLRVALELYAKTGMVVSRNVTATSMLVMAKQYTGKGYKRGEQAKAAADVTIWVNEMRDAIPVSLS